MSQAIGEVLTFGIGVALSPVAVIAMVLMLVTPRGRVSAWAFIAVWALSLGTVGTVVLLLADGDLGRDPRAPSADTEVGPSTSQHGASYGPLGDGSGRFSGHARDTDRRAGERREP